MRNEDTLSGAINKASAEGYEHTFHMDGDRLKCVQTGELFTPEDITIVAHLRFEGESDPDDMSVLYRIETRNGLKGVISEAYGVYSEHDLDAFIRKVQVDEN